MKKMNVDRKRAKTLLALTALMIAMIGVMPGASALTEGTATLNVGHPGTWTGGATELSFRAECRDLTDPMAVSLQGQDGFVIDVGGYNRFDVINSSSPGVHSLNVKFFTSACDYMSAPSQINHGSGPLTAAVISGAKWAVLSAFYGAQVSINWRAYNI